MALTPQAVLRSWIIDVLAGEPGGRAKRSRVLDEIGRRYGSRLTPEDRESPDSRPFETKWRNRASYERIAMIRDGILAPNADGYWELTGR